MDAAFPPPLPPSLRLLGIRVGLLDVMGRQVGPVRQKLTSAGRRTSGRRRRRRRAQLVAHRGGGGRVVRGARSRAQTDPVARATRRPAPVHTAATGILYFDGVAFEPMMVYPLLGKKSPFRWRINSPYSLP